MIQDPIERVHFTLSAGAIAISWAVSPVSFASAVTLGALLEAVNFRSLRRGAERLFAGPGTHAGPPSLLASAGFGLRLVLLGGVLAAAMFAGMHPVGLVIGLSLIVPSAVIGTLMQRPALMDASPGPPPDDASWEDWNPWLARERVQDGEEES